MKKIIKFFIKNYKLILLGSAISVIFLFFGVKQELALKINGDLYTMMGTTRAFINYISSNFNSELFPDTLLFTPHTNILTLIIGVISKLFSLNLINSFTALAVIGIFLLIFSFDKFLSNFISSRNVRLIFILTFFILVPLSSQFEIIGKNSFTINDILVRAYGWRLWGMALLFLNYDQLLKVIKKPSNKNYLILAILNILIINIHLLSYAIFLISVFSYYIALLISNKEKFLSSFKVWGVMAISFYIFYIIWPFYDISSLLARSLIEFQSSPIATRASDYSQNNPMYYLQSLIFVVPGLVLLFKEKNNLIKSSAIAFLIILLTSLIIPGVKLPLFWRMIFPIKLFLLLAIFRNIDMSKLSRPALSCTFSILLIINIHSSYKTLIQLDDREDSQIKLYSWATNNLSEVDGEIILADERSSNIIQSAGNIKTYTIPTGHISSRMIADINKKRLRQIDDVFKTYNFIKIDNYLKENGIKYIFLYKDAEFVKTYKLLDTNNLDHYRKIIDNSDIKLYEVI